MVMICPYCDMEINEKQMEAEDGCCPECGALITAGNVLSDDDEEDDIYDDDDDLFGDDDDDEFASIDDLDDDIFNEDEDFEEEPKPRRGRRG